MIDVKFKNVEKSELAIEAVLERFEAVLDRFPDLKRATTVVTLSMENSPIQAGPDLFTVKVFCRDGRYKGLTLQKAAPNLYAALADVLEHLLERLNRHGDRKRVKSREKARRFRAKTASIWSEGGSESTDINPRGEQ